VVETNSFQEPLVPEFQRIATAADIVLPIYPVDNRVKKEVRIRRLTPWLSQGKIRFKAGSPGARLLVEQLRDFPNAEHDDGPDALEMLIRKLSEGPGSETVTGQIGGR
jgi:predicted phage terminase large subunit-like protein